jgi:hypothetical protein
MTDKYYSLSDDQDFTITLTDTSDSIVLGDYYSRTIADDITVNTSTTFGALSISDCIDTQSSIQIGKHTITEEKLSKLDALLDIFESDEDLKQLLNTQIALNKLKS